MRPFRSLSVCVVACALLCGAVALAQESVPAVRIVNQIDERQLVTLKGSTHPLANAANDRGAAPDDMQMERMHLILKRSNSQDAALRQLIADMHTPGTASYHKWLTPDAFGKQFGPSDQDIATVSTWLASHGFSVSKVNPGKQTLEISGNVRQMREAFHTQIHKYAVNGETHYANAADPQIPAALSQVVGGFVSLNNFRLKSYVHKLGEASYDPKTDRAKPGWTIGGSGNDAFQDNFVLSPQDYAVQYDLQPLYNNNINGAGQTIAIVNESNINIARVNAFRTLFGLPANPPQVIIEGNDPGVDGINNPDGPNGASVEAYLDVEWAGAVAPNATIDLVVGADTAMSSGLLLSAEHAVYGNIAPVISLSFGLCESGLGTENAFLSNLWEQAAAQGITVMVSTGDSGSAGCDDENTSDYAVGGQQVSGFASTPYNVAVGGTDFYYSSYNATTAILDGQLATYWNTTTSNSTPTLSIKGVIPEQPWNDSQYGLNIFSDFAQSGNTDIVGGSGGASNCAFGTYDSNGNTLSCSGGYPKPAWQTAAVSIVSADGVRDIPDVSLFAANGINDSYYPICATDGDCQPVSSGGLVQIYGVGGTSASAPSFAGIMALVNQQYGRQGQADFVLYPLAKQYPLAFHDVTVGTNSVPCAYSATASLDSRDCIAVAGALTDGDGTLEGQIGTGTTPDYNAVPGYDLATGIGTVDANVLVNDWNKVSFKTPTTTLAVSPSTTFTHGTAVTLSGAVSGSPAPSGDVAILTGSTEPVQQGQTYFTLSNGSYSGTSSMLPGGTYNIWAQYSGDGTNGMSTSQPVSITVNAEASGIAMNIFAPAGTYNSNTTPGSAVDYGTQMNLSAVVAPSSELAAVESCLTSGSVTCPTFTNPTGTVAFKDNGAALNTAAINADGDAEYNAPFSVGAHSVTASYLGDSSYSASAAAAIPFTVVKDNPNIFYNYPIQTQNGQLVNGPGQPTVISFQVENGAQSGNSYAPVQVAAPTGTLTYSSSPSGISGTVTLSAATDPGTGAVEGIANIVVPAGTTINNTYNLSVGYSGDSNYAAVPPSAVQIPIINTNGLGAQNSTISATLSGSISPTSLLTVTGTVVGQPAYAAPTSSASAGYGILVYTSGNSANGSGIGANYLGAIFFSACPAGTNSYTSCFSASVDSSTLSQGANLITLQYTGDAIYFPSAVVLNSGSPILDPLSDFTMIPDTTIVPVTAGNINGTTDTINLASMNGFSGNVALSCAAAPGVTCTIPSTSTLSAGGSATAALIITAEQSVPNMPFNVLITGTDPSGKYVHTLGVQAVVQGSTVGSSSIALTNGGNLSIDLGATTGNSSSITVTPLGPFTGAVGLSCAITPASSTAATCTMSPTSVTISGTAAQTASLNILTTASTTPGVYTATVTGTGTVSTGTITPTTVVTVNVATPGFTVANSAAIAVAPGATTGNTSTITVNPTNGFTGAVTLSCAFTTNAATDPATCSIPASVTISGTTAATATLTIGTTAATAASNQERKLFWPSTGGAALALVLFFGLPKRRLNLLSMLGMLVLFVSVAVIGCGGGGSNGGSSCAGACPVNNPGTTPGTYSVTVTAVAGTITQTTTVSVTVN